MAQYTYNGASGKLGSFEGLGKSLLGDQQFGEFGDTARDQKYLQDVTNSMVKAQQLISQSAQPQFAHLPHEPRRDWPYWEFNGKNPQWVLANGKTYQDRYANRLRAAGSQPSAATDSGPSAGEVLTGVGTIVGALANPLANIFATTQQARLERERLKRGGGGGGGGAAANQQLMAILAARQQQPQGGGNTGIIIAVVAVIAVIGIVLAMR